MDCSEAKSDAPQLAAKGGGVMIDLNDGNWRPYSEERTKALKVFPNQLWKNGNAGALIVMKSSKYAEYALSKVGLDYLTAAQRGGRIDAAYIALATWQDGVIATKPASEVAAAVASITPRDGPKFGPFWWMKADLTPFSPNELRRDEEF
jgi:hypothetical protein